MVWACVCVCVWIVYVCMYNMCVYVCQHDFPRHNHSYVCIYNLECFFSDIISRCLGVWESVVETYRYQTHAAECAVCKSVAETFTHHTHTHQQGKRMKWEINCTYDNGWIVTVQGILYINIHTYLHKHTFVIGKQSCLPPLANYSHNITPNVHKTKPVPATVPKFWESFAKTECGVYTW